MATSWTITWLSASAVSVTTTKYLLERRLHFPMHLLVIQLVAALLLQLIVRMYNGIRQQNQPSPHSGPGDVRIPYHLLYALTLGAAFVCAYQAIHHFSNLPVAVMLLGLSWKLLELKQKEHSLVLLGRSIMLLCGLTVTTTFDFRPSETAITMSSLAVILFFVADVILLKERSQARDRYTSGSPMIYWIDITDSGLFGALAAAMFWCHFREQTYPDIETFNPLASDPFALVVNIISSSVAIWTGRTPFRYSTDSEADYSSLRPENIASGKVLLSVALVFLTSAGDLMMSKVPSNISWWQWIGFALASLAVLPSGGHNGHYDEDEEPEIPNWLSQKKTKRLETIKTNLLDASTNLGQCPIMPTLALIFLSWTIILFHSLMSGYGSTIDASIDFTPIEFTPQDNALEVVIARYREPASEVASHIIELLSLQTLQDLNPRFTIYNKNETEESSTLLLQELHDVITIELRPEIEIRARPNVGREAETYLHHIVSQYDNLAQHTLFMQAGVHGGPNAYIRRLRDYFVPSTGFLSLADTGHRYCSSCDECYDRDWAESGPLLRQIYNDFNPSSECRDLVLTYRGQFIASDTRVRRTEKETYLRWLEELRSPGSRFHTAPYTEETSFRKVDSLSAPRFGYTLERMWGVMMQCNEKRIAARCPLMLSSAICPPAVCGGLNVEDCQCLD